MKIKMLVSCLMCVLTYFMVSNLMKPKAEAAINKAESYSVYSEDSQVSVGFSSSQSLATVNVYFVNFYETKTIWYLLTVQDTSGNIVWSNGSESLSVPAGTAVVDQVNQTIVLPTGSYFVRFAVNAMVNAVDDNGNPETEETVTSDVLQIDIP